MQNLAQLPEIIVIPPGIPVYAKHVTDNLLDKIENRKIERVKNAICNGKGEKTRMQVMVR